MNLLLGFAARTWKYPPRPWGGFAGDAQQAAARGERPPGAELPRQGFAVPLPDVSVR